MSSLFLCGSAAQSIVCESLTDGSMLLLLLLSHTYTGVDNEYRGAVLAHPIQGYLLRARTRISDGIISTINGPRTRGRLMDLNDMCLALPGVGKSCIDTDSTDKMLELYSCHAAGSAGNQAFTLDGATFSSI